jgi:hypothetical protein
VPLLLTFEVVLHSNVMRGHTKVAVSLAAACAIGTLAHSNARADEDMPAVVGAVEELSGECPNLRFRVAGQVVATNGGTDFDDGDCVDMKNGSQVEVEGRVGDDGVLLATDVDLDVP